METDLYFTSMLRNLDLRTRQIRMAQAGHSNPAIRRADGSIRQKGPGGLPVGLIEQATYEEFTEVLRPGDHILILSDGIPEAFNQSGAMLGETRLCKLMQKLKSVQDLSFFARLIHDMQCFSGSESFTDDISNVLLEQRA